MGSQLAERKPLSGRRVFVYFLLFFLLFIAVDVAMATVAIRTRTGMITDHPYEKGLAYNDVVKAANEQDALGWKAEISFNTGELSFLLTDRDGHQLPVEKAEASFTRPVKAGMDFTATLLRQNNGTFSTKPSFPAKGLWEATVFASVGGKHYQHTKRFVIE